MEERDELERTSGTFSDSAERRQTAQNESPSPATQIGRAKQTGGTPASGLEAGVESREGWPMPDQSDTPEEWPQPTID